MLERAKERTAAEFGVVQAVLPHGPQLTTAEREGKPSPGLRPVITAASGACVPNSGGTVEYCSMLHPV